MELADVFLVIGEKFQELKELGCHPFFDYSGRCNYYALRVYADYNSDPKNPVFWIFSFNYPDLGTFIEDFLSKANHFMRTIE